LAFAHFERFSPLAALKMGQKTPDNTKMTFNHSSNHGDDPRVAGLEIAR
jgi:hypothetical protein